MHRFLCVALAALLLTSCNTGPDTVNRVQPNALEKSVLDGTWYYLQTVTDVPHTIAYTFVGEQSLMEKITWEVQEDLLIARRSYEWIKDGEEPGVSGTGESGAPVAVYAIESHFDIRRSYNTITGEEENVLVENTTDQPWYDRQFMRVDWSRNLITEAEFLIIARLYDGIRAESTAYYIEDPSDPDAPRFDRNQDDEVDYIDITNKMFVEPTMIDWDGEQFPSCWLLYQTHVDCAPSEIAVRHSFRKVDDDSDYQPWNYTGDRMERFGYFVSERNGYDPDYGIVEPERSYFVNRHDVWESSYRRGDDGGYVSCTADADCGGGGSVCDEGIARAGRHDARACTLPFRERTVKPIAYHLSERFPEDMVVDAQAVVDDWNEAFVSMVGSLRENECQQNGGSDCAAERTREDGQQAFVMCHNPVLESDHARCGEAGTIARIGDLRYSQLSWVHEPHFGVPLGFGPSSVDPETGETVQATAFNYGAGIEELATYARDLIALINGDLDPDEVISGQNVSRFIEAISERESAVTEADRHVIPLDGSHAHDVNAEMGLNELIRGATTRPGRGEVPRPSSRGELIERGRAAKRAISRGEIFRHEDGRSQARIRNLRDTEIEAMMANPQMRFAAGVDPHAPLTDATLDRASPLRGMDPRRLRAVQRERRRLRATRCVLRATDFGDEGLTGLAQAIRDAVDGGDGTMSWNGVSYSLRASDGGIDYDAVRDMLRHPIFTSTAAHEVGHTLGLRHNFSGSYDSLNYHPRYWELRDDGDMGPRAFDPITEAERAGRIREYQYSTVMDYGNNFVSTDAFGLGYYDRAAIKMGYGDLVEVFTEAADSNEVAWVNFMQLFGWPVAMRSTSFLEGEEITAYPYTEIPGLAGGTDKLSSRADVPYTSLVPDSLLGAEGIDTPLADVDGRPAVPYRFCSDEISDLAPDCMLYDAGADQYESIQSITDTYWNYYLFTNFRRQRVGFDVDPVYDRIYWRYFSKLLYANQDYVFNRGFLDSVFGGDPSLDDFYEREDGFGGYTVGIGAAFSMLSRVIATPEPGNYVEYINWDGSNAYLIDEFFEPEVTLAVPDARFLETTWNFDAGYFWFDQLERAGYYYDKVLALETLTDAQAFFVGEDEAADVRGFAISFHTTFPDATTGLLSSVLSDRFDIFGGRPEDDGSVRYPTIAQLGLGSRSGVPIDPRTGFSVQLFAAIYAMAFIPLSYDHTFTEQARIFVEGGAEAIDLPAGEVVRFENPFTSVTYVAASYKNPAGQELGVGARMLLHAQALLDEGADEQLDLYMDVINLQRTLSWEYGFGI